MLYRIRPYGFGENISIDHACYCNTRSQTLRSYGLQLYGPTARCVVLAVEWCAVGRQPDGTRVRITITAASIGREGFWRGKRTYSLRPENLRT
eukprot:5982984-Prymnesium_polylepis.1